MDLFTIISQRIPDLDSAYAPRLIFVNGQGLNVSHEEVLISTIASFLNKLGETSMSSLLLAARQQLLRYTGLLDPLIRRAMGRHQLFGFDFAEELVRNPMDRCDKALTVSVNRLLDDLEVLSKEHKSLLIIDDLTCVEDLGISTKKLLSRLLSSPIDYLIIGYHGSSDGVTDDYLLQLLRRRADFCIDVAPLDTGYSNSVDGQLTISTPNDRAISSPETQKAHFQYFVEGQTIHCYTRGASNLVR